MTMEKFIAKKDCGKFYKGDICKAKKGYGGKSVRIQVKRHGRQIVDYIPVESFDQCFESLMPKVYEIINKIKCTNAEARTINNWMLKNNICPKEIDKAINGGMTPDNQRLIATADAFCKQRQEEGHVCGEDCCELFLNSEVVQ